MPETREGGGNLAPCYPVQQNANVSAFNFKNKNNTNLAEANNFKSNDFPPAESFGEMDSAVSFRENIAEVDNQKTVRFKDGTRVVVPSEMDLDNSKIVEFLYNSAVKGAPVERQCEKTRVLNAGSDCLAVYPRVPAMAPKGPREMSCYPQDPSNVRPPDESAILDNFDFSEPPDSVNRFKNSEKGACSCEVCEKSGNNFPDKNFVKNSKFENFPCTCTGASTSRARTRAEEGRAPEPPRVRETRDSSRDRREGTPVPQLVGANFSTHDVHAESNTYSNPYNTCTGSTFLAQRDTPLCYPYAYGIHPAAASASMNMPFSGLTAEEINYNLNFEKNSRNAREVQVDKDLPCYVFPSCGTCGSSGATPRVGPQACAQSGAHRACDVRGPGVQMVGKIFCRLEIPCVHKRTWFILTKGPPLLCLKPRW